MPNINDVERTMNCNLHDDHFCIWTGFYKTFKTIGGGDEIRISPTNSGFLVVYVKYENNSIGVCAAIYHDHFKYCNIHKRSKEIRDAVLEAISWVLSHNDR